MSSNGDAFGSLAALFTSGPAGGAPSPQPSAKEGPSLGAVTTVLVGNVPVMAGLWTTQLADEVAKTGGVGGLVGLIALLSVSIGLLNLFPVPLLDGGHLLFYAFEVVRGRPLSERAQEVGFRIGLALVLMLMLFAAWNDILNLGASLRNT